MKLNASMIKTKTMIFSTSRTMHFQSIPLTIGGTVLKKSEDLDILGVIFDSNMSFEKHLRLVSRAASQRLGIMMNFCRVFNERSPLEIFWGFVLPVLEHNSIARCSAADTHLNYRAV